MCIRDRLKRPDVNQMIERGVGYIPEDRKRFGVSPQLSIAYNFMLRDLYNRDFFQSGILKQKNIMQFGKSQMQKFDVRAPSEKAKVGSLSGGNMQKVILARECSRPLKLLLACQPTHEDWIFMQPVLSGIKSSKQKIRD